MTIESFNTLKNFKATERNYKGEVLEKVEDMALIKPELMHRVDDYVTYIKKSYNLKNPKAIIHCITSGEHVNQSYHYKGMAVDLHITNISLHNAVMSALLFNFGGVGFYPYSAHLFIHLDIRPFLAFRKFWYRSGGGIYFSASFVPATVFDKLCQTV